MATFTTWTNAYTSMLDELAAGNTRTGSFTVAGKTFTYRSHRDFITLLDYVERRAKLESGEFAPRVYAKNGGRSSS